MRDFSLAAALLVLGTSAVAAQGALSTQGFGYPPGQISTRAASLGGGSAETDGLSALNPAAIGTWGRSGISLQYAPEYRTVSANGKSDKTSTLRFPLISGALVLNNRVSVGASASTLLDRTWETERVGYDHFGSDSSQFTENFHSAGSITDIQLGASYAILKTLWIGVSGHALSGDNQLRVTRFSTDTTFTPYLQNSSISYSGTGISGGLMWKGGKALAIGVSGRLGGTVKSFRNDTTLSRAKMPKQFGAGFEFTRIPGLDLTARVDWQGWSSLASLGDAGLGVKDTWDYGGGAELRGPSLGGSPIPIRVGFRHRTLPFLTDDESVKENIFSFGAGIPFARGRSAIDLGLQRANRSSIDGISEHAWIINAGFVVRP